MIPSLSSRRTRRRHGDADNPTSRASSTFCNRPSFCRARRMRLSIASSVKGMAFQTFEQTWQRLPILRSRQGYSPPDFPRGLVGCWDMTFELLDTIGAHRPAAALMMEVLRSEGVRYIFGNPGTTEMPLINALDTVPDISYVLGLQEASVVAMADGYATVAGRPGFVNVHTAGGLGHAMGALLHSPIANTPLVITAGRQDTRHAAMDPLLGGDAVEISRPVVKWACDVTH